MKSSSRVFRCRPVPVTGLSNVTMVSVGAYQTCAVDGGTAKCWGDNGEYQLGNLAAGQQSSVPVLVQGIGGGVSTVATGHGTSCAILLGSRAMKCWGWNSFGEVGDGSGLFDVPAASQVVGLTSDVARMDTGQNVTCAVKSGKAYCWGFNLIWGALGDGTGVNQATPSHLTTITGATAINAGGSYGCVQIGASELDCWGNNIRGQLGNGNWEPRPLPGLVVGLL